MDRHLRESVIEDFVMIINAFEKLESQTYSEFQKLFIDKKFQYIFFGQTSLIEKREFVEEAFKIVKRMWLQQSTFKKKCSRFYLLCLLYNEQPWEILHSLGAVTIRITVKELSSLQTFISTAQSENLDLYELFKGLYAQAAFQICYGENIYGLERRFAEEFLHNTHTDLHFLKSEMNALLDYKLGSSVSEALQNYNFAKKYAFTSESASTSTCVLPDELSLIDDNFCEEFKTTIQSCSNDSSTASIHGDIKSSVEEFIELKKSDGPQSTSTPNPRQQKIDFDELSIMPSTSKRQKK